MKIRNVLGLFDGISCGQVALQRAGIKHDQYYASEIVKNPVVAPVKVFQPQVGNLTLMTHAVNCSLSFWTL